MLDVKAPTTTLPEGASADCRMHGPVRRDQPFLSDSDQGRACPDLYASRACHPALQRSRRSLQMSAAETGFLTIRPILPGMSARDCLSGHPHTMLKMMVCSHGRSTSISTLTSSSLNAE